MGFLGGTKTLTGFLIEVTDVSLSEETPQVHAHILMERDTKVPLSYDSVEFCCHGCGVSVIVLADELPHPDVVTLRNKFQNDHRICPDFGFYHWCPDIRFSTDVVDLREKTSVKRKTKSGLTPKSGTSKVKEGDIPGSN